MKEGLSTLIISYIYSLHIDEMSTFDIPKLMLDSQDLSFPPS
jgi:hypothetical protein